jgi:DNA polymerase elongation subunit (family B)
MSFKLSRIAAKFDRGQWNIHKFGYNAEGKFEKSVDKYRDYFFYDYQHIGDLDGEKAFDCSDTEIFKTLHGEMVQKVYYSSIKSKNKLDKENKHRVFQADVKPEFKYVLDNNLEWSEKRHIMYYDIETWYDPNDSSMNKPEKAQMPITALVAYSTEKERYFVFSWHPVKTADHDEPKMHDKDNVTYIFTKTEEEMIMGFLNLVRVSNVDILSGWYSNGFDMPYIINRCKVLGLPAEMLSPVDDIYIRKNGEFWRINIRGLDHVDMMTGLQDMGYNLPNWKLDTAAKEILKKPEIEKITDVTWKDWLDDYDGFIRYAIRDVEILKEINDKIQMFDLYTTIQQTANLESLNLVFFKSMIVDNYIVKENHNKLIFPTRRTVQRKPFTGAIVIDPTEPGRSEDVTVMDYTSLYPTAIMAFNISPETYICSDQSCKEIGIDIEEVVAQLKSDNIDFVDTGNQPDLFGGRYLFYAHTHRQGLLPKVLKGLFLRRVEINRKLKAGEIPKDQIDAMTKRQWAFKLILNSAYGAMGFNYFRLCSYECADAITFFARQALKFAIVNFKDMGHKTLYGDTDSIFVKSSGATVDQMETKLIDFNENLDKNFVKKYNPGVDPEYQHMDLKFEYDLEYIYFGEAKKRYYGIIRENNKKVIRGMNIIRKDTPEFLKGKLNEMAEMSVRNQLDLGWLINIRKEIETIPYKELGISKAFSKPFSEYVKTMPQHVKASKWANEKLGTEISNKDNPYLFYIKSNCEDDLKKKDKQRAICLNDEDLVHIDSRKDIFEIDYDVYFQKQIYEQLEEFALIPEIKNMLASYKGYQQKLLQQAG